MVSVRGADDDDDDDDDDGGCRDLTRRSNTQNNERKSAESCNERCRWFRFSVRRRISGRDPTDNIHMNCL